MPLLSSFSSGSVRSFGLSAFRAIASVATDAYFNLTTLLLKTSSTDGAQNNTFLDSSTNNFDITRNGNTTQGTFTPFSQTGWSNYFDGTDDRLTTSSALLAYSTGSASTQTATIEAMVYLNAYNASKSGADENAAIVAKGSTYMNFCINHTGNLILYHYDGTVRTPTSSGTVPLNTWTHVAVTLSGGVATFYINGSSSGTGTWYGISVTADPVYIGESTNATSSSINGYLSNLRISTTARTITVPTAPYTSDASTALLTCQSNRFVDNSSNGYAVTVSTGTPSVQAFSPFLPTTAYDTAVVGGSGYFDGTGDYLATGLAANLDGISGNFTIEYWQYPITGANSQYVALGSATTTFGTNPSSLVYVPSTNNFYSFFSGTAGPTYTGGSYLNTWTHVAWVRSGGGSNNCTLYLNGVSVATSTYTGTLNLNTTNSNTFIGKNGWNAGYEFTGYLSSLRIVTSAVYTANFTPPTAPPTAITNTQLLLNYTNAGIFDSASKNVLETVGHAQASTTQAKFGTTSMYFDGTGDNLKLKLNNAIGSGDYTIEGFFYATASGIQYLFDIRESSQYIGAYIVGSSTTLYVNFGTTLDIVASSSFALNTWNHLAFVRSGSGSNNTSVYLNGLRVHQRTDTTNYSIIPTLFVACENSGAYYLTGYIDDFRITKGYARYSGSTYTQPTAAFSLQ